MEDRGAWLAQVFIELADTLVADFDLVDLLSILSERSVELLGGDAGAGVLIADPGGSLRVLASSTEEMKVIELFEIQHDEGPCLDSFRTGTQVLNQHLDAADVPWPRFTPHALGAGFRVVNAFPLRLRQTVIGAMNLFRPGVTDLSVEEAAMLQAFADAATIGILQERAAHQNTALVTQLQGALNHRIIIEQAKGMVSEQLKIDIDEAFERLRAYARRTNQRIVDVSDAILARRTQAADLSPTPAPPPSAKRVR